MKESKVINCKRAKREQRGLISEFAFEREQQKLSDGMSQLYWLELWGPIVMFPGSTPAGGELLIPVTNSGYWAFGPREYPLG
ncbi:hypothetical protein F2Q68_00036483 [Brassica cretica]|uniref:Uncharacterized protein n=1 Tax=Brassica cretica TaxID=69181 RepID=A0A8S9HAS4_BRACR|nr:hypothetical protein F2Q68_00036483 [Brassica cretica]